MIKKKELVELIQDRLVGELTADQKAKVHSEMTAFYIGRIYDVMVAQSFRADRGGMDSYVKTYLNVDIQQEASTEIYYSTLPAKIIDLPISGSGVRRISTMQGVGLEFVPMRGNELQIIPDLVVDEIDDVIGYSVENGRIQYQGMTTEIANGDGVRITQVIPFEEYDDDDNVAIPNGRDEYLVTAVINLMMAKADTDLLNDNNTQNIKQNG